MTESFVERTMDLIKKFEDISPITDDIIHTKTKEGEKIILTKASLAEKLKCRDPNNKISIEVCMNDYINPEKKKMARYIFDNVKIMSEEKQIQRNIELLSKYEYNEDLEERLEKDPDSLVMFCKRLLLEIDPTLMSPSIVLEAVETDSVDIAMKKKPVEQENIVERRMRDRW